MDKGTLIKQFIINRIIFNIFLMELDNGKQVLWLELEGTINVDLDKGMQDIYELEEFNNADYLAIEFVGDKTMINSMAIGTLIGVRNSCPKSIFCIITKVERIIEIFDMIILPIPFFDVAEEAKEYLLKGGEEKLENESDD